MTHFLLYDCEEILKNDKSTMDYEKVDCGKCLEYLKPVMTKTVIKQS